MIARLILLVLVLWSASLARVAAAEEDDYAVGSVFRDPLKIGGEGPEMVVVPGGLFVLGGWPVGTQDLGLIKIDYRLAFGVTEITRAQYRAFLEATHSALLRKFPKGGDDLPVTGISWDEAEAYVNWLSRQTGHYYRLPSASEWEYAARARTTTQYSWGDDVGENRANCLGCGTGMTGKPLPVKSFPPNPWGLYDVHGNVWEWTKDCIDPNSAPPADGSPQLFGNCDNRELRGGSARSDAWSIRAGARAFAMRQVEDSDIGFRVVMDVPL